MTSRNEFSPSHEVDREKVLADIIRLMEMSGITLGDIERAQAQEPSTEEKMNDTLQEEATYSARHERDEQVDYWTNIVAQGNRVLVGKFDQRRLNDPQRSGPRPGMAIFEGLSLTPASNTITPTQELAPHGNNLARFMSTLYDNITRDRSIPDSNLLCLYEEAQGYGDPNIARFCYASRMLVDESNSIDNRTGTGDPLYMYGEIPKALYPSFLDALYKNPQLIDDIFKQTFDAELIKEGWVRRVPATKLYVIPLEGAGPATDPYRTGDYGYPAPEVALHQYTYSVPFSRPAGESPYKKI